MRFFEGKLAGFYNNKFLAGSVVFALIAVMVWIVYASIPQSNILNTFPANNTIQFSAANITFSCNITTSSGPSTGNVTLYTNFSNGVWGPNTTFGTGGNNSNASPWSGFPSQTNFTLDMAKFPDFTYGVWACEVNTTGQAGSNFTNNSVSGGNGTYVFSLDTAAPTAFFANSSTANGSNQSTGNNTVIRYAQNTFITLNWTGTSEAHFINYTVFVYNDSGYVTGSYAFDATTSVMALNKTTANSTTNVTVSTFNGGNFPDGDYYWFVQAWENESAGARARVNSTQIVNIFIIDTHLDAPTLNFPANNTWINTTSIVLNYTVNDNHSDTCTILISNISSGADTAGVNLTKNQSNSSLLTGQNTTNATVVFSSPAILLPQGNFSWKVECNDTGMNLGNSTLNIFYVDTNKPNVTFDIQVGANKTLVNNTNISRDYILVSVSGNDTYEANITFGLFNATSGALVSNVTYSPGTRNHTFTGLQDGTYMYNVTIKDFAENVGNTTLQFVTLDTTAPVATMGGLALANNTYINQSNITFNVTITENGTANATNITFFLYLGNSSNVFIQALNRSFNLNGTFINNVTFTRFTNGSALYDNLYRYNATVTDAAGNAVNTETRNITLDTVAPSAIVVNGVFLDGLLRGNNTLGSNRTPTVNWSIVTELNFANYTLRFFNGTQIAFENISNESVVTNVSIGNVTIGSGLIDNRTYYLIVTAFDLAGNYVNSTSSMFTYRTDFSNATMKTISGSQNITTLKTVTTRSVTFNFTITETNPSNCSLYANFSGTWGINQTNASMDVGNGGNMTEYNHFFNTSVNAGTYVWNIFCNDTASPTNGRFLNATNNFTLQVDPTSPVITLITTNASTTSSRVVSFFVQQAGPQNSVNLTSIVVSTNITPGVGLSNFNASRDCVANGTSGYNCSYIETYLTASQPNEINITASHNNSASVTKVFQITPSAAANFTVKLASGWNLVSVPFTLENTTIDNVLANQSNVSRMYTLNTSGQNWLNWDLGLSDDFTTLEPRKGYWIFTSSATNLFLFGNYTVGNPPSTAAYIELSNGWHTIGYAAGGTIDNKNTEDILTEFGAGTCRASGTTASGCSLRAMYNSTGGTLTLISTTTYNTDAAFTRGRGYLARLSAGVNYTI
ncbi:hypothetical protein HYU14_02850 [Candidatus Woesearchaeota archaeon]|nr:hypothetical protein [Candidatus Woesearchaeota archaeon]